MQGPVSSRGLFFSSPAWAPMVCLLPALPLNALGFLTPLAPVLQDDWNHACLFVQHRLVQESFWRVMYWLRVCNAVRSAGGASSSSTDLISRECPCLGECSGEGGGFSLLGPCQSTWSR